jgi:hypothetical protein
MSRDHGDLYKAAQRGFAALQLVIVSDRCNRESNDPDPALAALYRQS